MSCELISFSLGTVNMVNAKYNSPLFEMFED